MEPLDIGEQVGGVVDLQGALPYSALPVADDATQLLHHQLHAVANPQHGDAQVPDFGITKVRPPHTPNWAPLRMILPEHPSSAAVVL